MFHARRLSQTRSLDLNPEQSPEISRKPLRFLIFKSRLRCSESQLSVIDTYRALAGRAADTVMSQTTSLTH